MAKKITYRIHNWKNYNCSLVNRDNLILWFSEDAVKNWYQTPSHRKKRGRPFTYNSSYIELALTLRTLFRFPLRATQGFLEGLVFLLGLKLQVSHYSQLSLRASTFNVQLMKLKKKNKKLTDLVIDSTGLKIFGEGEWKMRTHGKQKRRTWRKYHVAVDPNSQEVAAIELTEASITDGQVIAALLSNQKNIGKVYADGAYSYKCCLKCNSRCGWYTSNPIWGGTSLVKKEPSKGEELRNRLLKDIWQAGGTVMWKQISGYHR